MTKKDIEIQIKQKLEKLLTLLNTIPDSNIDEDDPTTWDYDTFSELETKLEQALGLLRNSVVKGKHDEFGEPLILEKGILSLVNDYNDDE